MSAPRQRFVKNFIRYNTLGPGFNPTQDFTISSPESVDEGAEADFSVKAFGLQAGSTIQWAVVDWSSNLNGRFDNESGDVTMLNGYHGAFAVTVNADQTTANATQSYLVGLSWNGQVVDNTVTEVIVNDTSQDPPPPPPPAGVDFFYAGDQDNWFGFGGTLTAGTYSDPPPANPAYLYPDGSYTGKTRNFTGTEWMASTNLSIGGAWSSTAITINFWFYPTAYGVQLMSECDHPDVTTGYHYSMLEIDNTGYVHGRFYSTGYPLSSIVSNLPVALNRWNHVYMTEFPNGDHSFELNGVPTNGNYSGSRTKPFPEYFVIGLSDSTSLNAASGGFQGKIGYLTISDYQASSTFADQRNRFRPAFVGFQSATNGGSNTIHIDSDPFNDVWLSTVPVGATIEAEGIGTFTVTGISAPNDPGNFAQNWWFSLNSGASIFPAGTRMTFSWT